MKNKNDKIAGKYALRFLLSITSDKELKATILQNFIQKYGPLDDEDKVWVTKLLKGEDKTEEQETDIKTFSVDSDIQCICCKDDCIHNEGGICYIPHDPSSLKCESYEVSVDKKNELYNEYSKLDEELRYHQRMIRELEQKKTTLEWKLYHLNLR